jgi:small conductance mechanosensitive channel
MEAFRTNKATFHIDSRVANESWITRGLHIVAGFIILILAHMLGVFLKGLIYRLGNDRTIPQRDTGENPLTPAAVASQQTKINLPFVIMGQIVYYTIMIIAVMMVFKLIGIETTGLLAIIGAAGFAIGLALQGTLSDIASGILLALLQVYTIGEVIEVNGKQGIVKDFSLVQTVLIDPSTNDMIIVPNRQIQEGIIQNHSRQKVHFVIVDVLVSNTNENYSKIIEVIRTAAQGAPAVLSTENVGVNVFSMNQAGTLLRAKVPIRGEDYISAPGPIRTAIRTALSQNNITMIDCTLFPSK